jgi:hypothetical protein
MLGFMPQPNLPILFFRLIYNRAIAIPEQSLKAFLVTIA